jgi:hypothetical protein
MLFIGSGDGAHTDAHEGYVAGRYRDGTLSGIWTDVLKFPQWTFTAYAPACECGWLGQMQPATGGGHLACRRLWIHQHFESLETVQPIVAKLRRHLRLDADFLP